MEGHLPISATTRMKRIHKFFHVKVLRQPELSCTVTLCGHGALASGRPQTTPAGVQVPHLLWSRAGCGVRGRADPSLGPARAREQDFKVEISK